MRQLLMSVALVLLTLYPVRIEASSIANGPEIKDYIIEQYSGSTSYGDVIELKVASNAPPGAEIYYSLNGGPETLYTKPIKIEQANVNGTAYAKYPGGRPGPPIALMAMVHIGSFEETIVKAKETKWKVAVISGVVTAKLPNRLYVGDKTATMAIFGDHNAVSVGDTVEARGIMNDAGQMAYDVTVTKANKPSFKVMPTPITLAQVRFDELVRLDHVTVEQSSQQATMKQGTGVIPVIVPTLAHETATMKRMIGIFERRDGMVYFTPREGDGLQYERTLNLQQVKAKTVIIEKQNAVKLPTTPFAGTLIIKANVALQGELVAATLDIRSSVKVNLFGRPVKQLIVAPGAKPFILGGEGLTPEQIAIVNGAGGRVQLNLP